MAEYIDKTELLQVESLLKTEIIENNKVALWLYEQMMHDIEAQPVADVAPVVHGKWKVELTKSQYTIKCSNCGRVFDRFVNGAKLPEHCFCGAKMDETE